MKTKTLTEKPRIRKGGADRKCRSYVPPTEHEIACCAYAIYANEEPTRAHELWRQAEAQLIASRQHDAGLLNQTESGFTSFTC